MRKPAGLEAMCVAVDEYVTLRSIGTCCTTSSLETLDIWERLCILYDAGARPPSFSPH